VLDTYFLHAMPNLTIPPASCTANLYERSKNTNFQCKIHDKQDAKYQIGPLLISN
jgi:hypothetical protein